MRYFIGVCTRRPRPWALVLALAALAGGVREAAGQRGEGGEGGEWNADAARRIAERAIAARQHAYADSSLRSFRARAQGHVYFLGDFQGERELARADQVALDVLWQAPDRALQTIVGRRTEARLPTRVQYHIDHLSLVLDNLGDRIRLGEGDEVWGVLHPAAPGALDFYEYRLVDSLEIRVRDHAARVYRLDVRPSDPSRAGVVGTLYVDRGSGAIARLRLTFTAAAYRDPELDYINLDLKSALWERKYWLPAEQEVEIRRELAWLSFPLGSVIRTRLRVLDYELNPESSFSLAGGQKVASLPKPALERYEGWESELYAGPLQAGDRSDDELAAARSRARDLVDPRELFGGERLRASMPAVSSGLRARRAEGILVGAGGAYKLDDRSELGFWGGYATGSEKPEARVSFTRALGEWEARVEARFNELEDIGPLPAASGVGSTFALALDGEDYTDPYFESGGTVAVSRDAAGGRLSLGLAASRQRTAELVLETVLIGNTVMRPIRPIDDGEMVALELSFDRPLGRMAGTAWRARLGLEGATGAIGSFGFTRGILSLSGQRGDPSSDWGWSTRFVIGLAGGDLPAQRLFTLGGRGTVPGYGFRPWGGDRFALLNAEVSRAIVAPWVRVRALAAAGWTDLGDAGAGAAARLGVGETIGVRSAAGAGLGLAYDLLRIDLVRGLDGGEWQLLVSFNPLLWPLL